MSRLRVFTLLLILVTALQCKKNGSDKIIPDEYYFEIEVDGMSFAHKAKYPPEQGAFYYTNGAIADSSIWIAAVKQKGECNDVNFTCYRFDLGVNKETPGTYDSLIVQFVINNSGLNLLKTYEYNKIKKKHQDTSQPQSAALNRQRPTIRG